MVYKNRTVAYIFRLCRFGKAAIRILLKITLNTISLLASSAKTSDSNDASANAARGGVLNYRTGKLDDGTDPVGWYEKD